MERARVVENVVGLIERSQRIACIIGAGISTVSGIPDFRSPGGMYDTLKPELLTATPEQQRAMSQNPTLVVDWDLFRINPLPYLEVRRPFILGIGDSQWQPSLAHHFLGELARRGKLTRLFSQNIDGLEYKAMPKESCVVSCHGSLGVSSCEFCGKSTDQDWFLDQVKTRIKDIYGVDNTAPIVSAPDGVVCPHCAKPGVKPSTVLYGRSLPEEFFFAMESDLPTADLVLILGTSLTVGPANLVPISVPDSTPRVVINMEPVGRDLGIQYSSVNESGIAGRDSFLQGTCDDTVTEIIKGLGWQDTMVDHAGKMCKKSRQMLKDFI